MKTMIARLTARSGNPRALFKLAGLLALAICGWQAAWGLSAHAPYAPFSVTVDDASTIFNSAIGFNGSRADLAGPFNMSGSSGGGWVGTSGTVTAHFQADPGFAFNAISLSFGQWSYGNAPFGGGHSHSGNWSVPGSVYVGDINPADAGDTTESWEGSGSSGSFHFARYVWWDGGGGQFRSIMGPWASYPIELENVSSFTLVMDSSIWVSDSSGYGVSNLAVSVDIVAVPESATVGVGFGLLALGLVMARRLYICGAGNRA